MLLHVCVGDDKHALQLWACGDNGDDELPLLFVPDDDSNGDEPARQPWLLLLPVLWLLQK
ncbi:hypothetical protein [Mucilaginibacter flavus]|uniref:hypothetical protein n=1 Tax=Mucilaginibacter flavus TaxID=931504 RepID=UPI0025B58C1A|nr:hypothetical protein [Mucilaginibacter flavus]